MLVFRERAEFAGLGQSCERVALSHLRERHGAFNELLNAVGGKVAGGRGGGALSEKDTQAKPAGAGLLEGFHFAHAHIHAELVALADDGLGIAGSGSHGQGDNVSGERFEVESGFGYGRLGHA